MTARVKKQRAQRGRKELVRPLPRVDPCAARPVTHLEERGAIRYPSLASVSMESLNALLDEALRSARRPAMAGAVGLAMLAGGCQEANDAPAATLAPLGEVQDMPTQDAPTDLALPGTGGWGSLGAGGGTGVPTTGPATTPTGGGTTPCDEPCDGGVDGGVDAGRRHVRPTHNTPHLRGRMPNTQSFRTAGVPMPVDPME